MLVVIVSTLRIVIKFCLQVPVFEVELQQCHGRDRWWLALRHGRLGPGTVDQRVEGWQVNGSRHLCVSSKSNIETKEPEVNTYRQLALYRNTDPLMGDLLGYTSELWSSDL
jgi:hypothetical protein